MSSWKDNLKGRFVVFDGPDGSGKSTQFKLFSQEISQAGIDVVEVREPGGTDIGERIRSILLDPECDEMSICCEMLLYMASRSQLVSQRIQPALQSGSFVLADRFVSATLAYQGSAGGIEIDHIQQVADVAVGGCHPDLVVIFDVDEEVAAQRLGLQQDRIEQRGTDFQRRVRKGFLDQIQAEPDRYLLVDSSPPPEEVFDALMSGIERHFSSRSSTSSIS